MKDLSSNGIKLAGVLIGIAATLMLMFTALIVRDTTTSYTGFQIVFGHEFASLGGLASGQIEFSILNLLAYLLPITAAMFLIFSRRGFLIATFLFGAAAVLLFLVPESTVVTLSVLGSNNEIPVEWTFGFGLIIAAILSVLGLLTSLLEVYKKS